MISVSAKQIKKTKLYKKIVKEQPFQKKTQIVLFLLGIVFFFSFHSLVLHFGPFDLLQKSETASLFKYSSIQTNSFPCRFWSTYFLAVKFMWFLHASLYSLERGNQIRYTFTYFAYIKF